MGCSACKQAAQRNRNGAQQAARRAAEAAPTGYTAENAVLLGEDDDKPARRVKVIRAVGPLRSQATVWVKGSQVVPLINDGSLYDVTDKTLANRVWMVGGYKFFDKGQADRVGEKLGIEPVEIA